MGKGESRNPSLTKTRFMVMLDFVERYRNIKMSVKKLIAEVELIDNPVTLRP